jgi:hypothetical protein
MGWFHFCGAPVDAVPASGGDKRPRLPAGMRKGRDHPGYLGKNPTIEEKSTFSDCQIMTLPRCMEGILRFFQIRPVQQALSALAKGEAIWKRLSSEKSTAV